MEQQYPSKTVENNELEFKLQKEYSALSTLYQFCISKPHSDAYTQALRNMQDTSREDAWIIITCTWGILFRNLTEYMVKCYTSSPTLSDKANLDTHLSALKDMGKFTNEQINLFYNIKTETNKVAHVKIERDILSKYVEFTKPFSKILDQFIKGKDNRGKIDAYFNMLKLTFDLFCKKTEELSSIGKDCGSSSEYKPSPFEYIDVYTNAKNSLQSNPESIYLFVLSLESLSRRNLEIGIAYKLIHAYGNYQSAFNYIADEKIIENIQRIQEKAPEEGTLFSNINDAINTFVHISYRDISRNKKYFEDNYEQIFEKISSHAIIVAKELILILDDIFNNRPIDSTYHNAILKNLEPIFQTSSQHTQKSQYNQDFQQTNQKTHTANPYLILLLCFFGGSLGVHRFYVGDITWGLVYLFTGGLFGIGVLVDLFKIITGTFKIGKNQYVKKIWSPHILLGIGTILVLGIVAVGLLITPIIENTMNDLFSSDSIFDSHKDIVIDDLFQLESNDTGYTIRLVEDAHDRLPQTVTLPSEYDGKPITEIAEQGFANCTAITSVVIPDSVTSIGQGAFQGCSNLESITLPFIGKSETAKNHEAVLGYIFGYESITTSISYTGSNYFSNTKPKDILGKTWQYTWYNGNTYFSPSKMDYYYYIPESLKTVVVTKQTSIPTAAFNGCKNLTTIQYPNSFKSITSIGEAAFQGCKKLLFDGETKSVLEFGNNITCIPNYAFNGCVNITEIIVPNTVTSIGLAAFKDCAKIEKLTIPFVGESENAVNEKAVLGYIFGYECATKEMASSPSSATSYNDKPIDIIGQTWQFTWQAGYDRTREYYYYYIPDSLKSVMVTKQINIPAYAFNGCKNIISIKYSSSVTSKASIGEAAFQGCINLKFEGSDNGILNIKDGITSIGAFAFHDCINVQKVVVPNTVISIGKSAFEGCNNIISLSVPFVGNKEDASYECAVLGYIFGYECISKEMSTSPSSLTAYNDKPVDIIGQTWQFTKQGGYDRTRYYYYYYIPNSLTSVTVTKQTSVPAYAFNGCKYLTTISYGSSFQSITAIGVAAFQDCEKLLFDGEKHNILEIGTRVTEIQEYAFNGCLNITEISFPNSVRKIGFAAFMNCSNLEKLTIPFLGTSEDSVNEKSVFGYIFGYECITKEMSYSPSSATVYNDKPVDITGQTWQFTKQGGYDRTRYYYYYFIPESLTSVTITKQKSIPAYAFNGCKNLTTITIPAGSTIGEYAFQDCESEIIEK